MPSTTRTTGTTAATTSALADAIAAAAKAAEEETDDEKEAKAEAEEADKEETQQQKPPPKKRKAEATTENDAGNAAAAAADTDTLTPLAAAAAAAAATGGTDMRSLISAAVAAGEDNKHTNANANDDKTTMTMTTTTTPPIKKPKTTTEHDDTDTTMTMPTKKSPIKKKKAPSSSTYTRRELTAEEVAKAEEAHALAVKVLAAAALATPGPIVPFYNNCNFEEQGNGGTYDKTDHKRRKISTDMYKKKEKEIYEKVLNKLSQDKCYYTVKTATDTRDMTCSCFSILQNNKIAKKAVAAYLIQKYHNLSGDNKNRHIIQSIQSFGPTFFAIDDKDIDRYRDPFMPLPYLLDDKIKTNTASSSSTVAGSGPTTTGVTAKDTTTVAAATDSATTTSTSGGTSKDASTATAIDTTTGTTEEDTTVKTTDSGTTGTTADILKKMTDDEEIMEGTEKLLAEHLICKEAFFHMHRIGDHKRKTLEKHAKNGTIPNVSRKGMKTALSVKIEQEIYPLMQEFFNLTVLPLVTKTYAKKNDDGTLITPTVNISELPNDYSKRRLYKEFAWRYGWKIVLDPKKNWKVSHKEPRDDEAWLSDPENNVTQKICSRRCFKDYWENHYPNLIVNYNWDESTAENKEKQNENGYKTGMWSPKEIADFEEGLKKYETKRNWKAMMTEFVPTRTNLQICSRWRKKQKNIKRAELKAQKERNMALLKDEDDGADATATAAAVSIIKAEDAVDAIQKPLSALPKLEPLRAAEEAALRVAEEAAEAMNSLKRKRSENGGGKSTNATTEGDADDNDGVVGLNYFGHLRESSDDEKECEV